MEEDAVLRKCCEINGLNGAYYDFRRNYGGASDSTVSDFRAAEIKVGTLENRLVILAAKRARLKSQVRLTA